jgi:hypothetical protein
MFNLAGGRTDLRAQNYARQILLFTSDMIFVNRNYKHDKIFLILIISSSH